MGRCAVCPVPAGSPCLAERDPSRAYLCDWAAEGDPVKTMHVVGISGASPVPAASSFTPEQLASAATLKAAARLRLACEHYHKSGCSCLSDSCTWAGTPQPITLSDCADCLGLSPAPN